MNLLNIATILCIGLLIGAELAVSAFAIAFWGAAIALSLLSLVPINNRMVRMDADGFTESTQQELRKWDSLHRVRVSFLAAAMIFFLTGIGI